MLSRLLKDGAETRPLAPQRWAAAGRGTGGGVRSAEAGGASSEAAQLRAAFADLALRAREEAKQAYETGRAAGEAAARERLEGPLRSLAEKLAAAMEDIARTRAEIIRRAEGETVRLAIEIAQRILHRELTSDAAALESLMEAALEKLQTRDIYRVRVHPGQEQLLRTCLERAGRAQGVAVIGDPSQPEGGLLFEISGGSLDASVETQMDEIERALIDPREGRG